MPTPASSVCIRVFSLSTFAFSLTAFSACSSDDFTVGDAGLADASRPDGADGAALFTDAAFPDAGQAVKACESCLESQCAAAAQTCKADPSCSAALACVITSGCVAPDAGNLTECAKTCLSDLGLTPKQTAAVLAELTELVSCAPACAGTCSVDGGK